MSRSVLLSSKFGYPATLCLVGLTIGLFKLYPELTNTGDVVLLLVVFLSAWLWESGPGILAACLAPVAYNYYFVAPLHSLWFHKPSDIISLMVFLASALIIGRLSATARQRLRQIESERRDLSQLTELSKSFMADTNRESLYTVIADRLRLMLQCDGIVLCIVDHTGAIRQVSNCSTGMIREDLIRMTGRQGVELVQDEHDHRNLYVPIRLGDRQIGTMVVVGLRTSSHLAEACVTLVGLAIEREQFIRVEREAERVKASEEMKSALLATLAHGLKTPLATAAGLLENWELDAGGTDKSKLARASLTRLAYITEDLLKVIKFESGASHPRREEVACGDIIEAAVERQHDTLFGHPLDQDISVPDLKIKVDRAQISEALGLGLENAARYSTASSKISLIAKIEAGDVVFQVHDKGPGIPAEDRERVMEKFVRLHHGEKLSGYGLGLYIARSLVTLNGGKVRLDGSPLGGTMFEIRLTLGPS